MKANSSLKTFGTLSHLMEWGKEAGYCDSNPFRLFNRGLRKQPGASVDSPTPHTIDEFSKFLFTAWIMDKLIFMAILLASYCGLRRKELLGITFEDLFLEHGMIKVRKAITKEKRNKKSRGVVVAKAFILFWKLIPVMDPTRRIIPLDKQEYSRRLKAVRVAAELPAWRKDKMRKNFSILKEWLQATLEQQQDWLGHERGSATTVDFYHGEADPVWADKMEKLSPKKVLGKGVQPCKPEDLV